MFASAFLAIAMLSTTEAPRLVWDADAKHAAWEVRVAADGLALNDESGAQEMLARLKRATSELCIREMRTHAERNFHTCRRETMTDAVQRLNAPLVTRAFQARR